VKLISAETGQALQLIVMDEVRPLRGGFIMPDRIVEIQQRYHFAPFATPPDLTQPIKFQMGFIELDGSPIQITSLEIYNDGIIVNSRHTTDCDLVMDDFIVWALDQFNLREPETKIPRIYLSRVVVQFESGLDLFIVKADKMKQIVARAFGGRQELEITRLIIGPPAGTPIPYQHTWQIEPRIGQPHVANRYFSQAPLTTDAHVEMLNILENIATDNPS
jgi:hypothetical protein